MVIIRALAFHAPSYGRILKKDHIEELLQFGPVFHRASRSFKTSVWTRRMILSRIDAMEEGSLHELAHFAEGAVREFSADFIALPLGKINAGRMSQQILEAIQDTRATFFSVKASDVDEDISTIEISWLVALIKRIAMNVGPEACARFAIAFGDQPATAYFPDTASREMGFSISLRYVPDLNEGLNRLGIDRAESAISEILMELDQEAKEASSISGLNYLGIDPSLSPWMEESVAKLITNITGGEFGDIGTHYAVRFLNSSILEASSRVTACGFKEIMLPVAEDNELKRLAADNKLSVSLLVSLISVCVAGLDMVLLPLSTPDKKLARLILDVFAIAQVRRKPLGIRLLLADSRPGEWVKLGRFGDVPVMSI